MVSITTVASAASIASCWLVLILFGTNTTMTKRDWFGLAMGLWWIISAIVSMMSSTHRATLFRYVTMNHH